MGCRLYVVEKNEEDIDEIYAHPLAIFNMSKYHELSKILSKQKATDCILYADDDDTILDYDDCNNKITECSISFVISTLEKMLENEKKPYGIYPVLEALKVFEKQRDKYKDLVVLHYGYYVH